MKKQIGIWLDYKEANIITLDNENHIVKIISSAIETYRLKGGSRSKEPYGPMDKTSESKLLERKKRQVDNFYKKIMEATKDSDEVFIMGPGEAKIGLRNKMTKTNSYQAIVKGFETVDSITEKQKIARTREFFGVSKPRLMNKM